MITRDHSWVNDVVDNGLMSEADALRSPMAHAIVRCLGGPAPDTISFADQTDLASVVRCILPAGSRLLLCSDGLWNYAQTVDEIADLVRSAEAETPLETARRLVRYAIACGGKDNITAAILQAD